MNGVAAAGGGGVCFRGACPCGHQWGLVRDSAVHREHVFWSCPVAVAVREQIQAGLGQVGGLERHHLWLLATPSPACCSSVWQIVCLAAVSAMEFGRKRLWAQLRQGGVSDSWVAEVGRAAGLRFWAELQDFVLDRGRVVGSGWDRATAAAGPGHPFLQKDLPGVPGWSLHVPVGLNE